MKNNIKLNLKNIQNTFTILIYILIIFSSMLPNKTNTKNLSSLNTIIPGIDKLSENNIDKSQKKYSIKFIELLQNFI